MSGALRLSACGHALFSHVEIAKNIPKCRSISMRGVPRRAYQTPAPSHVPYEIYPSYTKRTNAGLTTNCRPEARHAAGG